MQIKFVCGKDFLMDNGNIAFKKGEVYSFSCNDNGSFYTDKDEYGLTRTMDFSHMFIDALMIPYDVLKDKI